MEEGRYVFLCVSVPQVMDVGQCLVGGVKIAQFEIRNDGGPGRFALLKTDHWPASNFKVANLKVCLHDCTVYTI